MFRRERLERMVGWEADGHHRGGRRMFLLRRCTDAVILRLSGVRIGPGPRITDTPVTVRPGMTIRHKASASMVGCGHVRVLVIVDQRSGKR